MDIDAVETPEEQSQKYAPDTAATPAPVVRLRLFKPNAPVMFAGRHERVDHVVLSGGDLFVQLTGQPKVVHHELVKVEPAVLHLRRSL